MRYNNKGDEPSIPVRRSKRRPKNGQHKLCCHAVDDTNNNRTIPKKPLSELSSDNEDTSTWNAPLVPGEEDLSSTIYSEDELFKNRTISQSAMNSTNSLSSARQDSSSSLKSVSSQQDDRLTVQKQNKRKRFLNTAEALHQSGLLDITMKTASLIRKNKQLQSEIFELRKDTRAFVASVLGNPQNADVLSSLRSHKQIYDMLVPESYEIMSPFQVDESAHQSPVLCGEMKTQED